MNAIHVSREIGIVDEIVLIEKNLNGINSFSRIPLENSTVLPDSITLFDNKLETLTTELSKLDPSTRLAITGECLESIFDTTDKVHIEWLFERMVVFARAKPDQKSQIIEKFMSMGRTVGMCGDGIF